jgi:hypothetical protein
MTVATGETGERARSGAEAPPLVVPLCERCGAPVNRVTSRRGAPQGAPEGTSRNEALCLACDQRARRAAYFKAYYEAHRDRILDKNRRWARDNQARLLALRQARLANQDHSDNEPKQCAECGAAVVRAERCRKCHIRSRYANDAEYRARRLATTRRWLARRAAARRQVVALSA